MEEEVITSVTADENTDKRERERRMRAQLKPLSNSIDQINFINCISPLSLLRPIL